MKGVLRVILVLFALAVLCVSCGSSKQACPAYAIDSENQENVEKDRS